MTDTSPEAVAELLETWQWVENHQPYEWHDFQIGDIQRLVATLKQLSEERDAAMKALSTAVSAANNTGQGMLAHAILTELARIRAMKGDSQ